MIKSYGYLYMKSIKEVVAVTQNYVNTNIRVVRLQFLCISSFQGCFSHLSKKIVQMAETQLFFESNLVCSTTQGQAS